MRDRATRSHADEFRVGAELPRIDAEDTVTDLEFGDVCANCLDFAGQSRCRVSSASVEAAR